LNLPGMNLPCSSVPTSSFSLNTRGPFYSGARSRHLGGVHALFMDGSVHFIRDSIALATWQHLGWIADCQPTGD
jgi:prepilin-type processing-associated H-X9-DG protein